MKIFISLFFLLGLPLAAAMAEPDIEVMEAGAGATLVVPAVVTDLQPPACIVNSAVSEFSGDCAVRKMAAACKGNTHAESGGCLKRT